MMGTKFGVHGTYRPTRETFPVLDALAVAVAVDRSQGFIKSQQGYYDPDTDTRVDDNRVVVLRTLRAQAGKDVEKDSQGRQLYTILPTAEDHASAQEIFEYFDQVLLMDKMADALVKQSTDGRVNDFNLLMSQMFDKGEVDVNKELAMLVSLPNSRRIAVKREEMETFYDTHKMNGYIGDVKQRLKITGKVMDVKFIPRHAIHLATVVTAEGKLAKFFMNDKMSDLAKSIRGKDITLVGTVKKQEMNTFTGCQETVFNRIKLENE